MTIIQEVINSRGLDFTNQARVVMLRRQVPKLAFKKIALRVRNRKNKVPSEDVVRRVFKRFNVKKGRVQYKYAKCGRKPWKITPAVGSYIIRRLRQERRHTICTSTSLQADVYKHRAVHVSSSAIRKHLAFKGYHWLKRSQKRKYDYAMRVKREAFVTRHHNKSLKVLHEDVACAMDGVIVTVPPADKVRRHNHCFAGVTHMYRKRSEAASPDLAGDDPYVQQVPLNRCIPMWGAISAKGFKEIVFHKSKKLQTHEWHAALQAGKLTEAVKQLKSSTGKAPWNVLCDSESFLEAKVCKKYYQSKHIKLLHIPARSPDLNPIESFWGWLRYRLRLRDLSDLRAGRPALGKTAYRVRVRSMLKSQKAQNVAKAKFNAFKKVCQEVKRKRGAASRS